MLVLEIVTSAESFDILFEMSSKFLLISNSEIELEKQLNMRRYFMKYRRLLRYGFYNEGGTHTVVLNKDKVEFYNVNFEEQKENIKLFFKADTLVLE